MFLWNVRHSGQDFLDTEKRFLIKKFRNQIPLSCRGGVPVPAHIRGMENTRPCNRQHVVLASAEGAGRFGCSSLE